MTDKFVTGVAQTQSGGKAFSKSVSSCEGLQKNKYHKVTMEQASTKRKSEGLKKQKTTGKSLPYTSEFNTE